MSLQIICRDHWDLLKIIAYVAKADGSMRSPEVEIIHTGLSELIESSMLTVEEVKEALRAVPILNVRAFTAACRQLKSANINEYDQCKKLAENLLHSKKTPHPNEIAALSVMEKVRTE